MALELPVGYGEATFVFNLDGDAQDMTFALGFSADPVSDNIGDLGVAAGDVIAEWVTAFAATGADIMEGFTFSRVVTRLNTTATGVVVNDFPMNVVGTQVGDTVPNILSVLVRKVTALGGRKNRGRMFVPPFQFEEQAVDANGNLAGANVTDLQDRWDAFELGIDAGVQLVLLHSDPLDTPTPITGFTVRPRLHRQTRRYSRQ